MKNRGMKCDKIRGYKYKLSKKYITLEEGIANKFLMNNNNRMLEFEREVSLKWLNYFLFFLYLIIKYLILKVIMKRK